MSDNRDWQADMEMIEAYLEYRHMSDYPEQKLAGEPVANIIHYWLQQYAAEKERADRNDHAYIQAALMGENYKMEKERADIAESAYHGLKEACVTIGEYQSLLDKHTAMTKAYRGEKERADKLESRHNSFLRVVQEATEHMTWRNKGNGTEVAIKLIYKWLEEHPAKEETE